MIPACRAPSRLLYPGAALLTFFLGCPPPDTRGLTDRRDGGPDAPDALAHSSDAPRDGSPSDSPGPAPDGSSCTLATPPPPPTGPSGGTITATFVMTSVDFAQPEQGYDLDGVSTDSERAGTACQPRRIGNVLDLRVPTEGTCGIDSSLNLFLKEAQNFLSFSPKDLLFGIPDQADVDLCDRQVQTLTLSNFNGLADDAEVDIVLGISPRALPSGTTPPSTDGGPSSLVDGSLPSGDSAVAPVVCRASTSGTSSLFSWDPAVRTWEPPVVLTETFRGYVRNSQLIVDVPEDASRPLPLFVKYGLVSLQGGYIVTDLREGDVFKKLSTQEPLRDATRLRMNGIMTSTMAMPAVLAIFRNYRLNDVARAVACDYADMPFRPLTGKLGTDERCQGVSVTMHVSLVAVRTAGALTTPPDLTYMPIAAADESACAP